MKKVNIFLLLCSVLLLACNRKNVSPNTSRITIKTYQNQDELTQKGKKLDDFSIKEKYPATIIVHGEGEVKEKYTQQLYGNIFEMSFYPKEGYRFAYMLRDGKLCSYANTSEHDAVETYQTIRTPNMQFDVFFLQETEYIQIVVDHTEQVLETNILSGQDTPITFQYPLHPRFQAVKSVSTKTPAGDYITRAVNEQPKKNLEIKVDGVVSKVAYGEQISLKYVGTNIFRGWQWNKIILSIEKEYQLKVYQDMIITAVTDTIPPQKKPLMGLSTEWIGRGEQIYELQFYHYYAPKNKTSKEILEVGFFYDTAFLNLDYKRNRVAFPFDLEALYFFENHCWNSHKLNITQDIYLQMYLVKWDDDEKSALIYYSDCYFIEAKK